jgi:hypothetical protein
LVQQTRSDWKQKAYGRCPRCSRSPSTSWT